MKVASDQLRFPLKQELDNDEVFITPDAVQIMKFHGSYQQLDREKKRVKGAPKAPKPYQFMLRLKMPSGDFPHTLYQALDDIASKYGNNTLRATTRCAWQIHGILKGDLKDVFSTIMNNGGSTIGACGDLSRNVMCTPAPFTSKLYSHARWVAKMAGELFAPQTGAFSEIWLDGEKAASIEYWKNDINMAELQKIMRYDNGNGVVFQGKEEPIYGETYLPRKFKIGVTVPGDNSIDIYTQDIGVVCIPDANGDIMGYNLIVGGGMGRTHKKESTFARVGDHLGYVSHEKLWEALKAIVATQRDHGNREVRANARMKYLVDKLGINAFRKLVETYFGESFEPFRETKPWKYEDWLGWHEQGDGKLFLGLFIEHGRIKDTPDFKLRTALRRIIDAYGFDMVVSPNQNVMLKNILPEQKAGIEAILREHSVKLADEYDINRRMSMACPAMPLCGLALTEAERIMPQLVERMNALFESRSVSTPITMRMTGCPNGCSRPYMAELGFVGSGKDTYQLWLGGSPNQTRLAWPYMERAKHDALEDIIAPILDMYNEKRSFSSEAFGDFCNRMGKSAIENYVLAQKEKAVNGVTTTTDSTKDTGIKSVRGPPKVTVIDAPPAKPDVDMKDSGAVSSSSEATTEPKATSVGDDKTSQPKRTTKPRPRLTVSDEIMDRLKNIAALRDMSASNVADEIISAYLEGVEEEDLKKDK